MPVGPYPTFDACILAMKEKGRSEEEARRVCGAMEKESQLGELDGRWLTLAVAGPTEDGREVTVADLEAMAADYDPQLRRAPLVLGHPEEDKLAWGFIGALRLRRNGQAALEGRLEKVDPELERLLREGKLVSRSISYYKRFSRTGRPYLRHLGFLGAMPPAVSGLEPVEFQDGGDEVVRLNYKEELMGEEKKEPTMAEKFFDHVRQFFGAEPKPPVPTFTEGQLKERIQEATQPLSEKILGLEQRAAAAEQQSGSAAVRAFIERLKAKKAAPFFIQSAEPLAAALVGLTGTVSFIERDKDGKETKKEDLGLFAAFCRLAEAAAPLVPTEPAAELGRASGKLLHFAEPLRGQQIEGLPEAERMVALAAEIRTEHPAWTETQVYGEALGRVHREAAAAAGAPTAGQA